MKGIQVGLPSVLLVGAPGVGKGTAAKALCRLAGCVHLSVGEVFKCCGVGKEFVRRGELVPDRVVSEVCLKHVAKLMETGGYVPDRQVLVWDGFPRTVGQVRVAREVLAVRRIVVLEVGDEEVLRERMRGRGRCDDGDPAVMERRLEVHREVMEGLLGRYPSALVRRINAEGPPEGVLRAILDSCGGDFIL